jgi:hypothetical protein
MDPKMAQQPMDEESQKVFDGLVQLDPDSLTAEQRGFIRARRDYLNTAQRDTFASVLAEQTVVDEEVVKEPESEKVVIADFKKKK